MLFNATDLVIDNFVSRLDASYRHAFSNLNPHIPGIIKWTGRMVLERIADSDALYHNLEHTILVTLVGQEIMRGKHIKEGGVSPEDWLHFTISLLCHDIGYVRGVCLEDTYGSYVCSTKGDRFTPNVGASDAALTPYHVDRGKIFVRERFTNTGIVDVDRIVASMELTRFPVPNDSDHDDTRNAAGLVRAADLIGQLADSNYMRKINALFHEFKETGTADKLGYKTPADLAKGYPNFFLEGALPYVTDAIDYLRITQEGKQWIANLYAHVYASEHEEYQLGPHREPENRKNVADALMKAGSSTKQSSSDPTSKKRTAKPKGKKGKADNAGVEQNTTGDAATR